MSDRLLRMASIEIVESTGYQAFLEHVKESEECYTHLGLVHSTVNGTYPGYIKFYPDEIRSSKGLVNEVCGFLLAKALDIPIPRYAMILIMDTTRLLEIHPSLEGVMKVATRFPTWVTEQVKGVRIASNDNKALDSLRKWPPLPKLIAFDDWIQNTDRNLGNLVRERRGHFTCIDHGHIFGGVRWDRDLLPDLPFIHPLLAELWNNAPPPQVKSLILEAAHQHHSTFEKIIPDLDILLSNLLDNQEDKNQLLAFLERRARQSYDRLKSNLGLLI